MKTDIVKTLGIVINSVKYGESGVVVRIFAREIGLQSYIIVGARGRKRREIMPLLQPLSIVEMEAGVNQKSSLQHIREIHLAVPFLTIPFNETRRAISLYISELLSKTIIESEQDILLFDFVHDSIILLDNGVKGEANFHIFFMLKLAKYLGFEPNIANSHLPYFDLLNGVFVDARPYHEYFLVDDSKSSFLNLATADMDSLEKIASNRQERHKLINILEMYFSLHFPNFHSLESTRILAQIF